MNTTTKDSKVIAAHFVILNRFTLKEKGRYREWLRVPMQCGEKTVATNAMILVAVPKIEGFDEATGMISGRKVEKLTGVYPVKSNCDRLITRSDLESGLDEFPKNEKGKLDRAKSFAIGTNMFDPKFIKDLLWVAKKLNSDIKQVRQVQNKPALFVIGDVEFLLCPRYFDDSLVAYKLH